jgi:hypothetical protein
MLEKQKAAFRRLRALHDEDPRFCQPEARA